MDSDKVNVTYLLGAGASAKALPLVKGIKKEHSPTGEAIHGMPDRFREFVRDFPKDSVSEGNTVMLQEILDHLLYLADKSEEFGTIDTYAKYLFNREPDELRKLKNALSFYFCVEQTVHEKYDNRMLAFLTTIESRRGIPDNIKILTWNYDYQIELAGRRLGASLESINYTSNTSMVHQPGYAMVYPTLDRFWGSGQIFSVVHLNGIAGYIVEGGERSHSLFTACRDGVNDFIRNLSQRNHVPVFFFAWEEAEGRRIELAKNIAKTTDILVVIGYSFPFFNREIDRVLFENLKAPEGKLKKIYFQDPFNDGKFLKNQFQLDSNIDIDHISKVDSYFIPMEL